MPSNLKSHLEVSVKFAYACFFIPWCKTLQTLFEENSKHKIEPGYNDIGLRDTSTIAPDILRYQLIPHSSIIHDEALSLLHSVTKPTNASKRLSVSYYITNIVCHIHVSVTLVAIPRKPRHKFENSKTFVISSVTHLPKDGHVRGRNM
jgi:hypothetical protein